MACQSDHHHLHHQEEGKHKKQQQRNNNMISSSTTGYCYSDHVSSITNPSLQTHHQLQQHNFEPNPSEIYNFTTTNMELIGFPPPNKQSLDTWKSFFATAGKTAANHHSGGGQSSASKPMMNEFYDTTTTATTSEGLGWDESSLRCVFPCDGNERPSQGLSLSLSSTHPSSVGLQSFELIRSQQQQQQQHQEDQEGYFGKSMNNLQHHHQQQQQQQQQHMMVVQDAFLGKSANIHQQHGLFQIRNSKYLGPAQELLSEFCNLGTKQTDPKPKSNKSTSQQQQEESTTTSSSSKKQSLNNLELLELQKRKSKLLSMLEEVDRRYRHYCDQMKAVVSSFEAVAGNGAATVYSALAAKAMSRHFRCLRDGIVGQIKATKKAMGEKDTATPGTTRGETPRLRLLDQTLRQQRAFQQMTMMESHPWRPQRGLPERSVSVLRAWLFEHFLHPYPSDVDKHILARQTGLSRSQVSNWFINARVRLWKPMVEEMYTEETKEQEDNNNIVNMASSSDDNNLNQQNSQTRPEIDHKPTPDQLVRIDSECLSSIINTTTTNNNPDHKNNAKHAHNHQSFGRVTDTFGSVELDFSAYNHQTPGGLFSGGGGSGGGGGGGVSLTLGLQQHGSASGVSLAFSSAASQSSLYHIEDCQPVQYSLLDGDQGQNLPYRNLMGAQLLHDLAG